MALKSILIFDNDLIGMELFSEIFEDNFLIHQVQQLDEALEVLEQKNLDLLIYCEKPHDASGLEVLRKARDAHPRVTRILMYLEKNSDIFQKVTKEDLAHGWIKKPWDNTAILNLIENLSSNLFFSREYDAFKHNLDDLKEVIASGQLSSLFQPIARFEPLGVLGHELFTHGPEHSHLQKPRDIIRLAHHGGLMVEFECAARKNAIDVLSGCPAPEMLFLNNCPSVILSPEFENILIYDRIGLKPENIVIEIIESETLDRLNEFKPLVEAYRKKGFKIAVDDVGQGNAGLFLLTELKPDFAKLDMSIVRAIESHPKKIHFVNNLVRYTRKNNIEIIAEGIETLEEFEMLKKLGINMGQGHFLSRPSNSINNLINVP